jgi:uncharacterized protein involved in outer membrane biogenesis
MKSAKKILLVAFALVTAAVVAVVFLADRILTVVLTNQIAARTGLDTRLASAHLDFWPSLRVTGHGLELRKSDSASEAPVASVDAFGFTLPYNILLGHTPQVSDIGATHPVVRAEATAQALRSAKPTHSASSEDVVLSGPLTVTDGVIINEVASRHITARIEAISLRAQDTREGTFVVSLDAKLFGKTLHADARAASAADLRAGRPTRLDLAGSADSHAGAPLKVRTTLRATSKEIGFDDVTGTWQNSQLNGTGTLSFGDEVPNFTAKLRLDRLDLGALDTNHSTPPASAQDNAPLSDATMDLKSMRLVDGALDLKVGELRASGINVTNVGVKSTLDHGILRMTLDPVSFYQGKVAANLLVDASEEMPTEKVKFTLTGVKAAPFLTDLVGVKQFDGTLQFSTDLASTGNSMKAVVGNLAGSADLSVKDGLVTGHKVPDLFHEVAPYLPSAWRSLSDRIVINSITAKFAVAQGIASSNDLHIVSPVADITGKGNINLVEQTLDLRFDPKVSSGSSETKRAANPIDLGAAVLVRGPWSDPQVTADLSGIMRDPQKALENLQDLGQQFLGNADKSSPDKSGEPLKGLNGLLKGFTNGGDLGSLLPKQR